MSTYRIIDIQTSEIVAVNQTLDDLKTFANDLFWQDNDIDFETSSFEEVNKAIRGCDYDVEKE